MEEEGCGKQTRTSRPSSLSTDLRLQHCTHVQAAAGLASPSALTITSFLIALIHANGLYVTKTRYIHERTPHNRLFFFFFPSEKIIVPGQDGCKEGTLSTAGLVIAIVIVESHRVDIPEAGGTPEPVDLYLISC